MENQIEFCTYYSAENGKIILLGQAGKPFSYLLITKPVIAESFLETMGGAKIEEIEGLAGYPPLTIFFDGFDLEQLEIYVRICEVKGYYIDKQAIGAALAKTRMTQYGEIYVPHSIVEKPLVGQVLKDDSMAEYIAPMLIGSGLKKKKT
jgi:hypothetical protein